MTIVDDTKPLISKEKVFRLLGQSDTSRSARLMKKVDKQIVDLERKMQPRILYTTRNIRGIDQGTLTLEGGIRLKSIKLSKTFRKCERVTIFLATIGKRVDDVIKTTLNKKKLSDAYIYDAIGSAAVEATVDNFQNKMDAMFNKTKQRSTLRFSPGYCDWKIHEQKIIFSVLKNDLIDVDLNESCLMAPRKSVSGVFGIGSSELVNKDKTNPCRLCGMHACVARRV